MGFFDKKVEKKPKTFAELLKEKQLAAAAQKKEETKKVVVDTTAKEITDAERVAKLLEFAKVDKAIVDEAVSTNQTISKVLGKTCILIGKK